MTPRLVELPLALFMEQDRFAEILGRKDPVLLTSESGNLWISDNPVVMHNTFPYGRLGLDAPGIAIYYPISPKRCLALYCPSIREILAEAADDTHPRSGPSSPFIYRLHQSINDGTPAPMDENHCRLLNELQTLNSSRFLYASKEDFSLAKGKSSLRDLQWTEVRSQYAMSPLMVPPAPGLSEGEWLVIEKGHRHHCLLIKLLDTRSKFIDFDTTDLTKLAYICKEQPFDSVVVYRAGHGIRGLRDAVIEKVDTEGKEHLRVQHSDPGLNQILRGMG